MMAGNPLEQMMRIVAREEIAGLPHLQYPSFLAAKVTRRTAMSGYMLYNLKVLDADGLIDVDYPELPDVRSRFGVEVGAVVVIGLIGGLLQPYIIGEVV